MPATTGPDHRGDRAETRLERVRRRQQIRASSRAGHVYSAGRLNVYSPAESEREHVERPEQRLVEHRVHGHERRHHGEHRVRHDHEPPALDRVGERASDDREHEDGHELARDRAARPRASSRVIS